MNLLTLRIVPTLAGIVPTLLRGNASSDASRPIARSVTIPRASRGHSILNASIRSPDAPGLPGARIHVLCYSPPSIRSPDAPGLPGARFTFLATAPPPSGPRMPPDCLGRGFTFFATALRRGEVAVARSVTIPRASRGHLTRRGCWCSTERNDPPDKPGAFDAERLLLVARSVTIPRASRGHSTGRACCW